MAITRLLRVKEKGSQKNAGLKQCLDYILNPEKTEGQTLVTGNCGSEPSFIYNEMVANKKRWGKSDGTQAFHYILSFHPDEDISPDCALTIAEEFCEELFGNEHIWVGCAHNDKGHMHVHICFDSVSFTTGNKFHSGRNDWKNRIQPITDRLCKKYGLQTLSYDPEKERNSSFHKDWEAAQNKDAVKKDVSWHDILRDDIDTCISKASDWDDFLQRLRQMHYAVRDSKYLSLQPEGKEKAMRSIRLGEEYSKEALLGRIGRKVQGPSVKGRTYNVYGDSKDIYRAALPYIHGKKAYTPIQRKFYQRQMRLRYHKHPTVSSPWRYRKDVVRLGKITDMTAYLFAHDITSVEDILSRLKELQKSRGTEAAKERRLLKGICEEYSLSQGPSDILSAPKGLVFPYPQQESVYQIRINQTLFSEVDLSRETFSVRLPGSNDLVRLYSADSRSYNDGKTLSSYIYEEAEYQIESRDGTVLKRMTGDELKERFKSRKVEPKDKSQNKEEYEWKTQTRM